MAPRLRTIPRKLPRQARSRATTDAILTATARVLVRDGFDHASTNRIAEVAGVSIGSLYQYFPNKEALVAALVERHIDDMTAEIESGLARAAMLPVPQAVREMVLLMLRAHAIDPRLHRVLVEQVPRIGLFARVHFVEERLTQIAVAYFEARRRDLRPKNLAMAAFVTVQAVEALTHAALHRPELLDDPRYADEITTLVVRYLT